VAHFEQMPAHYWETVTKADVLWHLEASHQFFDHLLTSSHAALEPIIDWRTPKQKYVEVLVCTWDRHGLFAKIAAAFALSGIQIIDAEIFTRSDHMVIDVFKVCDPDGRILSPSKKAATQKLLIEFLKSDNFDEIHHRFLKAKRSISLDQFIPPKIYFDNHSSRSHTILEVQAQDQLGLLFHILDILVHNKINIVEAEIRTRKGKTFDLFQIVDQKNHKVSDPYLIHSIQDQIRESLSHLASLS
jgi:[protein-PII] uridylyltransferase